MWAASALARAAPSCSRGATGASASQYDEEEQSSLLGKASEATSSVSGVLRAGAERVGLAPKRPPPSACALCLPELDYSTRITGFVFCFALGSLFSLLSLSSFSSVLLGNPGPFAFKYTIGNVLSVCSYCFLVGPRAQCEGMFSAERRIFTLCYLSSFGLTLFSCFYLKNWLFTLVALAAQVCAMVLYALSYLPSSMGLGLVRRLMGC